MAGAPARGRSHQVDISKSDNFRGYMGLLTENNVSGAGQLGRQGGQVGGGCRTWCCCLHPAPSRSLR
jgi:hypothetical protein